MFCYWINGVLYSKVLGDLQSVALREERILLTNIDNIVTEFCDEEKHQLKKAEQMVCSPSFNTSNTGP